MPRPTPELQREYQRGWMRRRRARYLAGKRCVDCGSTEALEIDHVRGVKIGHTIWSWRQERLEAELAKCEIRCRPCHQERHAVQRRRHGIGAYKRGCRCESCRAAKAANNRRYRERRQRELNARPRLCRPVHNHSAMAPDLLEGYALVELSGATA